MVESIAAQLPLNEVEIKNLIDFGAIYLQGQRCLVNKQVLKGSYLRVHQRPRRFPVEEFNFANALVFENQDLLVVNKPSGLPVHPTVDNIQENLVHLIQGQSGKKVFVTHRLDVATSGLILFAKNKESQAQINSCFSRSQVKKLYRALVHGSGLRTGEILHYMQPSPRAPKTLSACEQEGWQMCKLKILECQEISSQYSELIIELLTGRTHQIRAQMSYLGFPVVGDQAYGSLSKLADFEKICLQSFNLSLPQSLSPDSIAAMDSTSLPQERKNFVFRLPKTQWPVISKD